MSFSSDIKDELHKIENKKSCCVKTEIQIGACLKGLKTRCTSTSNRCCKKTVLRAAFMNAGSLSDPEKSYHLEITFKNSKTAEFIAEVMSAFKLNPKIIFRNDAYVVYLKEGEDVVVFLSAVGAHNSLMLFENVRIKKELSNTMNRIANFDTANIEKIVNASVKHTKNIKYIDEQIGINALPLNLRETAKLRMENNAVSLEELGKMFDPPISKSGVNHRLRKLTEIADDIRRSQDQ